MVVLLVTYTGKILWKISQVGEREAVILALTSDRVDWPKKSYFVLPLTRSPQKKY